MRFSMHHINTVLSDIMLFIILQIAGISPEINIRLQVSGLAGSMLAVRMMEGNYKVLDWLRVAVSGMILSNFAGFAYCEWQSIPIASFKASFVFFVFGIASDVVLRLLSIIAKTFVSRAPELTNAIIDGLKNFIINAKIFFQNSKKQ